MLIVILESDLKISKLLKAPMTAMSLNWSPSQLQLSIGIPKHYLVMYLKVVSPGSVELQQ